VLKNLSWTRLVPPLAWLKVMAGLAALLSLYRWLPEDRIFPHFLYPYFLLAFGIPAALLLLGGRQDSRAVALGSFFVVTATVWCDTPLNLAVQHLEGLARELAAVLRALEIHALMPLFLWAFVRDFPAPPQSAVQRRRLHFVVTVSAWAGLALLAANFLLFLVEGAAPGSRLSALLGLLKPMRGRGPFYAIIMPLTASALAYLAWKRRSLDPVEHRRVRLFLLGIVVGFTPMLIDILLQLFGGRYYREIAIQYPALKLGVTVTFSLFVSVVPLVTTYAVLVHHVLDIRLIARRALQYALARYSAMTLATVPLLAVAVYLYLHQKETLQQLLSGLRFLLLLSASAVGAAALRYRKALLEVIDRRFFREQYDARQILTLLVERIRAINDVASLASLIAREIDLALHLDGITLMVVDPRSGNLNDPRRRVQRLDTTSELAKLVSDASDPLSTDLEDPRSPVAKLSDKERHWLVDSGFKLIVPIVKRDGSLLGLIGLGGKKSGLPFLKEDRQLLHAVASSAAWVLELANLHSTSGGPRRISSRDFDLEDTESALPEAELAKECPHCGSLYPAYTVLCSRCSKRLEPAHVPYVLPGKFRFEKRIGAGGMGVVYRGSDLALGRPVAVKTLRRVSPEDAMRLRREARTAAAVSHHYLAPVYGMETWQGTPMLVLELLEGGTLAQRIEKGRMSSLETVELGIAMADALAQLHAADILHRDIKPSNIGYTKDNVPKLMDFGIARAMFDLRRDRLLGALEGEDAESMLPPTSIWNENPSSITISKQLVGTLSYLSPEALNGDPADASFDLWGLAVVLYECLLGRKVFSGDAKQVMARIRMGRVPELSQVLPGLDESLEDFFRTALHKAPARRPATALEFKRRLEAVRGRLAA
jgi:eukaryotic-like serine/threonine-protein kinase